MNDVDYENIVKQYHDCLCPACLSAITKRSPSSPSGDVSASS